MTEQRALDAFLALFAEGKRISTLEAAIRDARWARNTYERERTSGLWLVSLAYLLILVEVLDKKLKTKHHLATQNTATKVLSINIS